MTAASLLLLLAVSGQSEAPLAPPLSLELRPDPAASPRNLEPPAAAPAAGLLEPRPAAPLAPPDGQPTLAAPPAFAPAGEDFSTANAATLTPPAAAPAAPVTTAAAPRFAPAAAPTAASPYQAEPATSRGAPVSSAPPQPTVNPYVQPLLDAASQPPARNALAGNRVSLADALARSTDAPRRLAITKHYWFVTYLVGEYHLALERLDRLQDLGQPQRQADQIALEAAKAAALAQVHEAELNAVVAQYELADLAMLPVTEALPLPADRPFTGRYGTQFDALFAGRTAPISLRKIDRTLPLRHRLIGTQATSAAHAGDELASEIDGYRAGQTPLATVLAAQQRAFSARSAFLMAVRQYNFDIAEYVAAVSAPNVPAAAYIEMLIGSNRGPQRSVVVGGNASAIRPVAAVAPLQTTPADRFAAPANGAGLVDPNAPAANPYGQQPLAPAAFQPAAPQFQSIPAGGIPLREVSELPAGDATR